ncbi:MAG: hypothetical protein ACK40Z_06310 [Dietzia sp.]
MVAGTLLVFAYRLRMWVTRRSPAVSMDFAPPARRNSIAPLPASHADPDVDSDSDTQQAATTGTVSRAGSTTRWAAFGAGAYMAAIAALLASGWAHPAAAGPGHWAARTLGICVVIALLWWMAHRRRPTLRLTAGAREQFGCALVGVGLVWFALGIGDMHLWSLFHLGTGPVEVGHGPVAHHGSSPASAAPVPAPAHGGSVWEWVFHTSGPVLVIGGWLLLPIRPVSPTPSLAPAPTRAA